MIDPRQVVFEASKFIVIDPAELRCQRPTRMASRTSSQQRSRQLHPQGLVPNLNSLRDQLKTKPWQLDLQRFRNQSKRLIQVKSSQGMRKAYKVKKQQVNFHFLKTGRFVQFKGPLLSQPFRTKTLQNAGRNLETIDNFNLKQDQKQASPRKDQEEAREQESIQTPSEKQVSEASIHFEHQNNQRELNSSLDNQPSANQQPSFLDNIELQTPQEKRIEKPQLQLPQNKESSLLKNQGQSWCQREVDEPVSQCFIKQTLAPKDLVASQPSQVKQLILNNLKSQSQQKGQPRLSVAIQEGSKQLIQSQLQKNYKSQQRRANESARELPKQTQVQEPKSIIKSQSKRLSKTVIKKLVTVDERNIYEDQGSKAKLEIRSKTVIKPEKLEQPLKLSQECQAQLAQPRNKTSLDIDISSMERAQILKLLILNRQQFQLPEIYPRLMLQLNHKFTDEFQYKKKMEQTAGSTFQTVYDFNFKNFQKEKFRLFYKDKNNQLRMHNRSTIFLNLTLALNFLNDKWLIERLFENPRSISKVGLYSVWLCVQGEFRPYFVDDILIAKSSLQTPFNHMYKNQLFPMLLEKAICKSTIKLHKKLQPEDYVKILTGAPVTTFKLAKKIIKYFNDIQQAVNAQNLVIIKKKGQNKMLPVLRQIDQSPVKRVKREIIPFQQQYLLVQSQQLLGVSTSQVRIINTRDQQGRPLTLLYDDFVALFESVSICHVRPQNYYSYQKLVIPEGRVCEIKLVTKSNNLFISIVQSEHLDPIKLTLYRQLSETNKNLLTRVKEVYSKDNSQTIMEIALQTGTYFLFVQAMLTNIMQNLHKNGFNPLLTVHGDSRPANKTMALSFYSKQRVRISKPLILQNQGSGVGNDRQSFIAIQQKDLKSIPKQCKSVQGFIKLRKLATQQRRMPKQTSQQSQVQEPKAKVGRRWKGGLQRVFRDET